MPRDSHDSECVVQECAVRDDMMLILVAPSPSLSLSPRLISRCQFAVARLAVWGLLPEARGIFVRNTLRDIRVSLPACAATGQCHAGFRSHQRALGGCIAAPEEVLSSFGPDQI